MKVTIILILGYLLLATGVANAQSNPTQLSDSQLVIENQIQAFHQSKHEEAFTYAAPALQIIFRDVENFIRMVKHGYSPIYAARSWEFGRSRVNAGKTYHEVLISGPEGKDWVALYSLQQQSDGNWKITGVQLLKSKTQST